MCLQFSFFCPLCLCASKSSLSVHFCFRLLFLCCVCFPYNFARSALPATAELLPHDTAALLLQLLPACIFIPVSVCVCVCNFPKVSRQDYVCNNNNNNRNKVAYTKQSSLLTLFLLVLIIVTSTSSLANGTHTQTHTFVHM